jgi:ribonuclease BN (tRNA processing enzyme)
MIKVLGAYGGIGENKNTTSILVDKNIAIDAGNILNGLGEDAMYIDHILVSHSHLDHIKDIPFMIDKYFEYRFLPLKIYGLKETIDTLKKHIFNFAIWPDFSQIKLLDGKNYAIEFVEIEPNVEFVINDIVFKPIVANHTVATVGFIVSKDNSSIYYSGDTYTNKNMWDEINSNLSIKALIIDISFPSRLDQLAKDSKHLTPKLLASELKYLKRDIKIYINHMKPSFEKEIRHELKEIECLQNRYKILKDNDEIK